MGTKLYVQLGGRERVIEVEQRGEALHVLVDGEPRAVELVEIGDGVSYALRVDGRVWDVMAARQEAGWQVLAGGGAHQAVVRDERERRIAEAVPRSARHGGRTEVKAPMPGLVVGVAVAAGDEVAADARLLSLEAMKMENEIRAPAAGRVIEVRAAAGQKVEQGQVLVVLE